MTEHWRPEQPGTEAGWSDDDELFGGRTDSYPPDSLVTLRFLKDSLRRHAFLWITVAAIGVILGTALPYVSPPGGSASAKLLLTHRDGDSPEAAMATDASLITTRTVAALAIKKLGVNETPDQLLKQYSATALTERVLQIDAKAGSTAAATDLANAVATVYLEFRSQQIAAQEEPLQADLTSAVAAVKRAEGAVRAAGGNPNDSSAPTTTLTARLAQARENQRFIESQLLEQQVAAARMSTSRVLDQASPVQISKRHMQVIYTGSGMVVGLFLGIGFIIVRTMLSDRLWRRQDVAQALGVPIRLSVGRPKRRLRRPSLRRLRTPEHHLGPVVRHLAWHFTTDGDRDEKPALAVVSVDNAAKVALAVASLALSFAKHGHRVLVADLTESGDLAATFRVKQPGTFETQVENTDLAVNVHRPKSGTGALEGLRLHDEWAEDTDEDKALRSVWAAADVVLVQATLSPALGADHLRAWSSRAAIVVTAGRSNATTLHGTGEMIRLAGLHIDTAVLLGADRTDDTLGLWEETAETEETEDIEDAADAMAVKNTDDAEEAEQTKQSKAGNTFGRFAK